MRLLSLILCVLNAGGPSSGVTVSLTCSKNMNASAVGVYGGQSVSVSCRNGRVGRQVIQPTDTTYSFRIGVETPSTAFDCAVSGDALPTSHDCAGALLAVE